MLDLRPGSMKSWKYIFLCANAHVVDALIPLETG